MYLNLSNVSKIRSSWVIFPGFESIDSKPIACSSNNYTFEKSDFDQLNFLREWIRNYFLKKSSLNFYKETKLIDRVDTIEYDFLLQIVDKKEIDDKIIYYVQDETDGCELHTFKFFDFLEINEIIRVRSVKLLDPIR